MLGCTWQQFSSFVADVIKNVGHEDHVSMVCAVAALRDLAGDPNKFRNDRETLVRVIRLAQLGDLPEDYYGEIIEAVYQMHAEAGSTLAHYLRNGEHPRATFG